MRALLATLLIALAPPVAAAHTGLDAAAPPPGADLSVAPDELRLGFAQPVGRAGEVAVIGPSGRDLARNVRVDPADAAWIVADLRPDAPGSYAVRWSIVAADGHTVGGDYPFRARRTALARPLDALSRAMLLSGRTVRERTAEDTSARPG